MDFFFALDRIFIHEWKDVNNWNTIIFIYDVLSLYITNFFM